MSAQALLLEREDLLEALDDALVDVRAGSGRLILVAGEAGVGKTALVRAFCDHVTGDVLVLHGSCDPLFAPRPLAPFLDVAAAEGGDLGTAVEAGAGPHEIVSALAATTNAYVSTVVVLEDVHWADEATLDTVRLLARKIEQMRALVIATYRNDELDRTHPLRVVLGELATRRSVARLEVSRLSAQAVAELAEPAGIDAAELYRQTSGNPFFVTEVLAAGSGVIPPTVRDAVLARAARLSSHGRALLDAVAVAPPRVELWLLDELAPEVTHALEECLTSGMLTARMGAIEFSHDLARLAIEDSLEPRRRLQLHRRALTALATPPHGELDFARLAHHAEAAGDADAVLRFAPAAGAHASSVGAHREAAEQYARALRVAAGLAPGARAELLKRRSHECYLTDQAEEAIDALRKATECYRELGNRTREGETLAALSNILWCPGRGEEARRTGLEAVAILEQLPPGRELASAYINLSFLCRQAVDTKAARKWGNRALELATDLDDADVLSGALITLGTLEMLAGFDSGRQRLEGAAALAEKNGLEEFVADAFFGLAAGATFRRAYDLADVYFEKGLAHCSEHGNDLMQLYFLAHRAHAELERGLWTQAAESATLVLRERAVSTYPRTLALVVLALVRARRGDPDALPLLDEARALADPTGEPPRIAPVAAAQAEAAWLRGDFGAVRDVTETALDLARRTRYARAISELQTWRRRAGIRETRDAFVEEPYALGLAGDSALAAATWAELGCPYEAALALADSDDEKALRRALEELNSLGARPAAAIVARRLRKRGARDIPRGPRPTTRQNPAQLTARELQVLELVAGGLRNGEIAERLVVSPRTVDHHVSAILRKLGAHTRGEAAAEAARLGLLQDR